MERAVEAARQGDLLYFSSLPAAELAVLIQRRDDDERSLLHTACSTPNTDLVHFLADHGAAPCVTWVDEEGWTPLHTAASAGQAATAGLLLSLGADSNALTAQQRSPLHYAASKGQEAVARLLLGSGAHADARDCLGATPLHRAAATGRTPVVKLLLGEGGAQLDPRNKDGATPLLLATMGGHQTAALFLAAKGADVEVRRPACVLPAWCMKFAAAAAPRCSRTHHQSWVRRPRTPPRRQRTAKVRRRWARPQRMASCATGLWRWPRGR